MYKDLEENIDEFQDIIKELKCYQDEMSYYELCHIAVLIQKNQIEYEKIYLEERKLETFKKAHAIYPNVPSALEAISMCLGMGEYGKLSISISDKLSDIADAINKD